MNTIVKMQRKCQLCGKLIQSPQAKMYCSIQCRNFSNVKRKAPAERIGKICPICGHHAYRRASDYCAKHAPRHTTTSTPERIAYVREHYPGEGATAVANALGLTVGQIRMIAQANHVTMTPEAYRRIVHAQAAAHMVASNPMHNPQSLNKMLQYWEDHPEESSERATAFLKGKQRSQRKNPSKPEKKAARLLRQIGIEHEAHALIKPNFIVDFRLGSLIIQVDGEYWHGHPRYEPLTERQRSQRRRDAAQDKYLTKCGYTVVRIWENDISRENLASILVEHGLLQNPISNP